MMRSGLILLFFVAFKTMSFAQGRVVVNEFMSWSGCNTTSEFIELLNFGPGPMDIGCFIVTNGQYAVTIPPNTILKPGEYYVLAGRDVIETGCGNIDSAVVVDLNWTTCNCTDKPVPATGDGFLGNGGGANEKIVLMNASGNVLDAVSRSSPTESVAITPSSVSGACTPTAFDLDTMAIAYEVIGIATGIDNSYSRRVDGDCGWVKTTSISAGAPNKTGNSSSASYSFTTLNASQCSGSTGTISINVSAPDLAALFPMTYLLAYDADGNNIFEDTDIYTTGSDSSTPSIDINNLAYGRYRITVGSSSGCNLQSFDFFIFNCYGLVLPHRVISFKSNGTRDNKRWFQASIAGVETLKSVILEANTATGFEAVSVISPTSFAEGEVKNISAPLSKAVQYRIRLISKSGIDYYSAILSVSEGRIKDVQLWPNPASSIASVKLVSRGSGVCNVKIINPLGQTILTEKFEVKQGDNVLPVNIASLSRGVYQLSVEGRSLNERVTVLFRKD